MGRWRFGITRESENVPGWRQGLEIFFSQRFHKNNSSSYPGKYFNRFWHMVLINKFTFRVTAVHKEGSQLICNGYQLIGFHMSWRNTESLIT